MVTWIRNANNFQIAKVQPQSIAQHLLNVFAIFSLALLIKVLLIKKRVPGTPGDLAVKSLL